ncbi:unnamed protein product (macronuclear) [Paramecium tetraurelia]|uniref:DNA replication checkpoint mediator MRC1 domain-containing protein n=1 Tax=Paramecium tetraurelia TaxID=5888 RepID=A0BFE9_PARTE|nr:uncharacterized protein GSPATT00028301001 [Paramecium tetraurelia]CAK57266.1 unnamed protein product [Paramecium tetraurelia]|eukprot:XP_001424664.1 hypothetical protein (macronuclear) [Paramecium tetraurelia strain d4-2]
MSENDSNSVHEVSAPIRGRLQRAKSSEEEIEEQQKDVFQAEQPDSIEISDQSDIQEVANRKKQKKQNQNSQKPRKPRQKKQNENAANQNEENQEKQIKEKPQKQVKTKKKGVENNEKTIENLLSKKFIQAEEEDEPPRREMEIEYESNRNERDTFGVDNKQNKRKAQNAKNINQLIKNRHKFFTEFEDAPIEFQNENPNYQEIDTDQFELKFEKQQVEESAIKQKAKRDMLNKVQQYKQNVLVFGDQQKSQKSLISSTILPSQDLESNGNNGTTQNNLPKFPQIIKAASFIQEEQNQKLDGESRNSLLRKTYSMGLKKGLSQEDIEDPELQLFIPKINGAKDKIFENTLFLNKIKQKGFDRVVQTSSSLNNSNKAYSRSEFQQLLQQKQVEHKANKINLSLNELMNRFQSTTFEQIEQKRQQNQKANNGQDDDDSSPDEDFVPQQNELNQESEDIDDGSSQSCDDNNKLIDDKVKECKLTEKEIEKQEKNEAEKEKNYGTIIEEKSDAMSQIDDEERQQLQQIKSGKFNQEKDYNLSDADEEDEDQNEDDQEEQEQEENKQDDDLKKEDHKVQENNKTNKLALIDSSDDDQQAEDINEEDLNMFRRLKKVSTMFKDRKRKEKELEEKKKLRLERQKEREKMKKFIESNLVEDQAEQGSDNESHDDVVKEIKDDDEEEDNEVIEKELLEMIDDKIEDLDEENEIRAFQIFMDRIHKQEKDDIKKILKGEFKRRDGKVSNIDLLNMEQTEEEKQARLMHKFEESEEENYDSDFENYLKMNKDQKNEFLKEKRLQKILQAQKEMNQQTKKNRLQEQQLFQPDLLKIVEQARKKQQEVLQKKINQKPPSFGQSLQQQSKINENSNAQNSNSVSLLNVQKKDNKQQQNKTSFAINRLFSANLNSKGQQLQKSPNKAILLMKKK